MRHDEVQQAVADCLAPNIYLAGITVLIENRPGGTKEEHETYEARGEKALQAQGVVIAILCPRATVGDGIEVMGSATGALVSDVTVPIVVQVNPIVNLSAGGLNKDALRIVHECLNELVKKFNFKGKPYDGPVPDFGGIVYNVLPQITVVNE